LPVDVMEFTALGGCNGGVPSYSSLQPFFTGLIALQKAQK
jgi:hypothetical protein